MFVENPALYLSVDDLEAALTGFTPASIRGIALHTPGDNTWKDVGGLSNIKSQLVRMLEWPAKVIYYVLRYRLLILKCNGAITQYLILIISTLVFKRYSAYLAAHCMPVCPYRPQLLGYCDHSYYVYFSDTYCTLSPHLSFVYLFDFSIASYIRKVL